MIPCIRVGAVLSALVISVAVAGCGGGAVAVRSNFSDGHGGAHATTATPAPRNSAPPSAPRGTGLARHSPGLTVSGGNHLGIVIVLGLMIADGVHWIGSKLEQAFGDPIHQTPLGKASAHCME